MQPLNLRVMRNYVIVQKLDARQSVTSSGLHIIHGNEKTSKGIVVAVGEGENNQSLVNTGETVLFLSDAGMKTKIEQRDCIILKEDDILAVME